VWGAVLLSVGLWVGLSGPPSRAVGQGAEPGEEAEGPGPEGREGAVEGTVVPVDLFEIMRAGGWELAGEEDLADYLPIPPRADGQIGRFARAGAVVSVARVTYPAEVFADPHESWIRERIATLPDAHERVVRRGATVIHVRGAAASEVEAAAQLLEAAWSGAGDEGE
jgi:hypothetical protein